MAEKSERFEMRVSPAILRAVDGWRSQQIDQPARAEAIRSLVIRGLYKDTYSTLMSDVFHLLEQVRFRGVLSKEEEDIFHRILMSYTKALLAEQHGDEPPKELTPKV